MPSVSPPRAVGANLRVAAWNAEWAPVSGVRGGRVSAVLAALDADVICLTEGFAELLPGVGHVIAGAGHSGYPGRPGQRRVLLWSREPWRDADADAQERMPHEGFVSAVTDAPGGPIRVIGLCIPWSHAGLRDGSGRRAWDLHVEFLRQLGPLLVRAAGAGPLIVGGDFNQFVPRVWGPKRAEAALREAFTPLEVATAGPLPGLGGPVIDHVAHTWDLRRLASGGWRRKGPEGPRSDHDGAWVDLRR